MCSGGTHRKERDQRPYKRSPDSTWYCRHPQDADGDPYCSYEVPSDWAVFGLYLSHFAQCAYVIGVSHTCADCLGAILHRYVTDSGYVEPSFNYRLYK